MKTYPSLFVVVLTTLEWRLIEGITITCCFGVGGSMNPSWRSITSIVSSSRFFKGDTLGLVGSSSSCPILYLYDEEHGGGGFGLALSAGLY